MEYAEAVPFQAEMWPGGGKIQTEMYGVRLPNIRNLRLGGEYKEVSDVKGVLGYQIDGGPLLKVGDGVCLYSGAGEEPDYKVVAIYPNRFLTLEVEKT